MILSSRASALVISGLAAFAFISAGSVATSAHPSIDIAVKNWSFTPATIEAHVGEPTLLRFTSSEGVHGVELADIGLAKTVIMPSKVTEVSFTPKTAGTYAVHCAVICGEGHDKMVLSVKVVQ